MDQATVDSPNWVGIVVQETDQLWCRQRILWQRQFLREFALQRPGYQALRRTILGVHMATDADRQFAVKSRLPLAGQAFDAEYLLAEGDRAVRDQLFPGRVVLCPIPLREEPPGFEADDQIPGFAVAQWNEALGPVTSKEVRTADHEYLLHITPC